MALRQGRGTGAVRCQVLLHEPEIDVFEMMLCKHAPSQAVDKLVGHDEHYEYDGKQQTRLGRQPQQRMGFFQAKSNTPMAVTGMASNRTKRLALTTLMFRSFLL